MIFTGKSTFPSWPTKAVTNWVSFIDQVFPLTIRVTSKAFVHFSMKYCSVMGWFPNIVRLLWILWNLKPSKLLESLMRPEHKICCFHITGSVHWSLFSTTSSPVLPPLLPQSSNPPELLQDPTVLLLTSYLLNFQNQGCFTPQLSYSLLLQSMAPHSRGYSVLLFPPGIQASSVRHLFPSSILSHDLYYHH